MKTVSVLRFDRGSLRKPRRTPQGFLEVDGHVARAGIYEYVNTREDEADGFGKAGTIRRELRPEEVVFAPESIATLVGAPITNGHPRKNGKRVPVTAENVKEYEVGTVMAARADGDLLLATHLIKSADAIIDVESGKQELSPGYAAEVELRSGTHKKYGRYDCVQTKITYNHDALVQRGRGTTAAKRMRLHMDEAEVEGFVDEDGRFFRTDSLFGDAKLTSAADGHQHLLSMRDWQGNTCTSGETGWAMSEGAQNGHSHPWVKNDDGTITIGESSGHTHTILDEKRYSIASPGQRTDSEIDRSALVPERKGMSKTDKEREDEMLELQGQLTAITKERDELRAKLAEKVLAAETEAVTKERQRADEAEQKLSETRGTFHAAVRARAALDGVVRNVLGPTFRTDEKDDADLIRAVVHRLDASIDVVGTPLPELRGHFKQLVARHDRAKESYDDAAKLIGANRTDSLDAQKRADELNRSWNAQHLETLKKGAEVR